MMSDQVVHETPLLRLLKARKAGSNVFCCKEYDATERMSLSRVVMLERRDLRIVDEGRRGQMVTVGVEL